MDCLSETILFSLEGYSKREKNIRINDSVNYNNDGVDCPSASRLQQLFLYYIF